MSYNLRPRRVPLPPMKPVLQALLGQNHDNTDFHGATEEDVEGRNEELGNAIGFDTDGQESDAPLAKGKRKATVRKPASKKAAASAGAPKARRRSFDWDRVFRPRHEVSSAEPETEEGEKRKKQKKKSPRMLQNKARLAHRHRDEKEVGRVKDGAVLVESEEGQDPSKQATKDGFLGRGGKGDRFYGTEKKQGMVFHPTTEGSLLMADQDVVFFYRSHDMGGGWEGSLTSVTDVVEAVDRVGKISKGSGGRERGGDGGHRWILIGTDAAYQEWVMPTAQYLDHLDAMEKVRFMPEMHALNSAIERVIKVVLPNIWARYDAVRRSADVELRPWFGLFHQVAFNLPTDKVAVYCKVHTDARNLAFGVCVIAPYGDYDPDSSFHLVFPTLNKVIAFGQRSFVVFPSALLPHGNMHGGVEFEVWEGPKGGVFPAGGGRHGMVRRGSVVWFSQGNIIRLAEKGMGAGALKKAGRSTSSGFNLDVLRTTIEFE